MHPRNKLSTARAGGVARPRALVAAVLAVAVATLARPSADVRLTSALGQTKLPATSLLATYHGDIGRTGFLASSAITPFNAGTLKGGWTAKAVSQTTISAQPAVVDGVTYWGDWAGYEHATSATGKRLWSTFIGQTNDPVGCRPNPVGVGSSPSIALVNGKEVVVTGGGDGNLVELNAATGAVIWSDRIAPKVGGFIWSSPTVWNGSVYIGEASYGDCPFVPGHVYMANAATGRIERSLLTIDRADGCNGDGVWSSPTIDAAADTLYVSTGNNNCGRSLEDSMLQLDASTLALEGSWQLPTAHTLTDDDWGSTPTLFSAEIGGSLVNLVGSAAKNGVFYAFHRGDVAAGPIWHHEIAKPGGCPQCGYGSIAPAAFDGTSLYVGGGMTWIEGVKCKGSVQALDPATGQPIWQACYNQGPVLGAITVAGNVVFAGGGDQLLGLSTRTGDTVFSYTEASQGWFYAPATVQDGIVYAGNTDGTLRTWALSTKPATR